MTRKLREVDLGATAASGKERPERHQVQKPTATSGPEAAHARSAAAERQPDKTPDRPDEQLEARIDKLLDAANAASSHARNVYITFLLFGLYLAIIFGSTTHEQLLRESPVTLPLLNVGLPLVGFYWVAPALFVLLHLNLLLQLILLSGKLHRLNEAIGQIGDQERQKDERSKLFPFPFTQMLAGWTGHGLTHSLVTFIVWTTVVVLPVLVLLFGQLRFLPYHGWETTCWHRFLLLLDLAAIWLLWSRTIDPSGKTARRLPATRSQLTKLLRPNVWPAAIRRAVRRRQVRRRRGAGIDPRVWGLRGLALIAAGLTLFLIAIPGTPTARLIDGLFGERARLVVFPRNLELQETELIVSRPDAAFLAEHGEERALAHTRGLNLRGRDLRFAELSRSDLRKADLRGSDLEGSDLQGAKLQATRLDSARLVAARADGVHLEDAVLDHADLRFATLKYARLERAFLLKANLQHTNLNNAALRHARLEYANLQDADLSSADLRGASLKATNLRRTEFSAARLHGVSFTDFRGAILRFVSFEGARVARMNFEDVDLKGARLVGADIRGASLKGVDLRDADLRGADLRGADLSGAIVGDDPGLWRLADLRGILTMTAGSSTEENVSASETENQQSRRDEDLPPAMPFLPDEWKSKPSIMFRPDDPVAKALGWDNPTWPSVDAYDRELAAFLGNLACGATPDNVTLGVEATSDLASRALNDPQRLYARLLAARLFDDDCPPTADLPDWMRVGLKQLAAELDPGE